MNPSTSITPKHTANEIRAAKLLGLMFDDPTRTQHELCELLGIGSRNTLIAIIRSETFQRQANQLLGGLKSQLTAQLADGVPNVLAYQLGVGAGQIGDQVRDHVGAGRVVREFLSLLLEYSADDEPDRGQPVLSPTSAYYVSKEDEGKIVKGRADFDADEIKAGYTMGSPMSGKRSG